MGYSTEAEGTAGPSESSIGSTPEGDSSIQAPGDPPGPAATETGEWIVAVDTDYYPYIMYFRNHTEALAAYHDHLSSFHIVYLAKVELMC